MEGNQKQRQSLITEAASQAVSTKPPTKSPPSEKIIAHSSLASSAKALGASPSLITTNTVLTFPPARVGAPSCGIASLTASPASTPFTDSSASFPPSEHPLEVDSWRGELVFPCVDDSNKRCCETDIFAYTHKKFRGREIHFSVETYPANEQGWESLRQDLIESARRHGYHLTSRGRDTDRNRIRLVCQQYRLYKQCGDLKSNHAKQDHRDSLQTSTAEMSDNKTTHLAEDKPPLRTRKGSKRPKTIDMKCRVQLSIFYKHWGDPKGYFYLRGGTGEAVHSHHPRLEPEGSSLHSHVKDDVVNGASPMTALPSTHVAKLPTAGTCSLCVDASNLNELQPHFDRISSALLLFPQMMDFAKQSLTDLACHISTRGAELSESMEGSEQEVLSTLSSMKDQHRNT